MSKFSILFFMATFLSVSLPAQAEDSKNQAVIEFQAQKKKLSALYAEDSAYIKGLADIKEKRIHARDFLWSLTKVMSETQKSGVNFFTANRNPAFMPFRLIGKETMPPECFEVESTEDICLKGDGIPKREEFANPDALIDRIGKRLERLTKEADAQAKKYSEGL